MLELTNEVKQSLLGRKNLSEKDYRKAMGISQSELKWLTPTPAHYKARKDNPPLPTKEMEFGTVFHKYLLDGPDAFSLDVAVGPFVSRATKEWKAFAEQNEGKILIQQDDMERIESMATAITSNKVCSYLLQGEKEQSFFWQDDESGLICKARCDVLHSDGLIIDVKTTKSADPTDFATQMARLRYHVQAAFYLDGIAKATNREIKPTNFIFIAIEREAPFAHAVYSIDQYDIERGRQTYKRDLITIAQCQLNNNYPGFEQGIQELALPAWYSNE